MAIRGERSCATAMSRPVDDVRAGAVRACAPAPRPRVRARRLDPRGQSLVEFAISAPVVLLMVLFGIDFGRVFLGWVTLTNAVREAANFAALNPTAWGTPGNPAAQAEYARLVRAETVGSNCDMPATIPDPAFPAGIDIGSPAVAAITCQFTLITPLIGNIVGSPIDVSASASFPVRTGAIAGVPGGGILPTAGPTVLPTPTIAATPSPIATIAPPPTPVPMCTVPNLKNKDSSVAVGSYWVPAGFSAGNLVFSPLVPPHYKIRDQSLAFNSSVPCTSTMTVTP